MPLNSKVHMLPTYVIPRKTSRIPAHAFISGVRLVTRFITTGNCIRTIGLLPNQKNSIQCNVPLLTLKILDEDNT